MQSPNFKSTGKLRVDVSQGCFQALNRAANFQFRAAANFESRISSCRHRIQPPRTSNQAANFLSTTSPIAPSFEPELQLHGELRISSRQRRIQSPANFKSSELRLKFDSLRDREDL